MRTIKQQFSDLIERSINAQEIKEILKAQEKPVTGKELTDELVKRLVAREKPKFLKYHGLEDIDLYPSTLTTVRQKVNSHLNRMKKRGEVKSEPITKHRDFVPTKGKIPHVHFLVE